MCHSKLCDNLDSWKNIHAPDYIVDWIRNGVPVPLTSDDISFELDNHRLSVTEEFFVDSEIQRLLLKGYVELCDYKPRCVSPIGCVPKKNKKYRLITDLRQLNSFCSVSSFKNDDIREAVKLVKPADRFVTTDIKDGFYHIQVNSAYRDYLGFQWKGTYFRWTVLPFGLSCSPYYFNKTLRPVVGYLRSLGVRVSVFVDDFLLAAEASTITDKIDLLLHTLSDLGFEVNFEKSVLEPSETIKYLGYHICSKYQKVVVRAEGARVLKLKQAIRRALKAGTVTARALARICGQCISVAWAVTPGKLFLRNAYRLLATRSSWKDLLDITDSVAEEFTWWLESASIWNTREICCEAVQAQIVTDASHLGWGAIYDGRIASGDWNRRVSCQSSNERELLAILMALKSFGALLKGKRVQILTDNISAMAYIRHMGGPSPCLSQLAIAVWAEAMENGIWLDSAHIAGKLNTEADYWSRTPDRHNWRLHQGLFMFIDRLWGPHTVDRFANCQNTHLARFNSRYWDPLSEGVDALAQKNWASENNYVNPPFCLLHRVLEIIRSQKAWATIIAPAWKAQTWYMMLKSMLVAPPLKIPNNRNSCRSMGLLPEPCRNRKWELYAWRVFGGLG